MNDTVDHSIEVDGFIKFLLAIVLAVLPFYLERPISYAIFLVYLLLVTLASKIKYRTLLLSGASYGIIVLIPYLFGILVNSIFYYFTKNPALIMHQGLHEVVLRLFRLFIIWYVSILYFHTTPMSTVLGLLDKLLYPLKLIKVPVRDYLKIIMVIVMDLKGTGEEVKTRFLDNARTVIGENQGRLTSKFSGISRIIVASLVDSFQKLDKVEEMVEKISYEELFTYKFSMALQEWGVVGSTGLIILILHMAEKGNGFIV